MKKTILPVAVAALAVLCAAAAKNGDPVLMKINGKDVHKSEFEYLYNKNNSQQADKQSVDEYIDMFVTYKLKVADAEAAGIDTTASFIKEYQGYCDELARPYLRDSLVEKRLVEEAYQRMGRTVDISQIMLPLGGTLEEKTANRARLDSIRSAILAGADFTEMALKYSSDPSVKHNKGHYGFINANMFPYPFEYAAFNTPVGEISEVVEDAPFGFHIIRVEGEKANPGRVRARHILKMTRDLTPEQVAEKKAQIDSIYNLLQNGADFGQLAMAESEDPGSAQRGGELGAFGPGRMVPEFEAQAFALADGEISKPFETSFGYHIVQTIEHLGIEPIENAEKTIRAMMARDVRSSMPETEKLNSLKKDYKAVVVPAGMDKVKELIAKAGNDSVAFVQLETSKIEVAKIDNSPITAAEVTASIGQNTRELTKDAFTTFSDATNSLLDERTIEYAKSKLAEVHPEYRNLINEYRDGILLFEISNRNVWERSSKDKQGLETFFQANRDKYRWDAPKYKGYVIFATSDSIADAAKTYLAANKVEDDSLVSVMKDQFGRHIKVEKVIAGKGENAILDNVAFGGEKPAPVGRWNTWFGYEGRILNAPEEAADARGAVTSDYQQELERHWVEGLKAKYPVKLNKKEIKKLEK